MGQEFKGKGVNTALAPVTYVLSSALASCFHVSDFACAFVAEVLSEDRLLQEEGGRVRPSYLPLIPLLSALSDCLSLFAAGFAPDVYLNGIASKLSVRGLQDSGVVACSKHFIAYEQETFRSPLFGVSANLTKTYQQIDSVVDDKTMHEVYLPGFAEAVRAGTGSIMCSYVRPPSSTSSSRLPISDLDFLSLSLTLQNSVGVGALSSIARASTSDPLLL